MFKDTDENGMHVLESKQIDGVSEVALVVAGFNVLGFKC